MEREFGPPEGRYSGTTSSVDHASGPDETGIADLRPELRKLAEEWGFATPKPDARAAREARRREISAVLTEDARRFPAFATARMAAVMAAAEVLPSLGVFEVRDLLPCVHTYERLRGGMSKPAEAAADYTAKWVRGGIISAGIAAYERARSLP